MQLNEYTKLYTHSAASLAAEGSARPPGAEGMYRTIMYARNPETEEERGFWGSCFYYQDDSAEMKTQRLERAARVMIQELERSDIYNNGNYDIRNPATGRWEKP
jgi:hypothetical protein